MMPTLFFILKCPSYPMGWRQATRPILLLSLFISLSACSGFQAPEEDPNKPPAPEHPETVKRDLITLVADAQKGDTKAIDERFEKYLMTKADFDTLFPAKTVKVLWTGYRDKMSHDLKKESAGAIVKRVKAGYTNISYESVGPTNHKETTRGDYALLKAMKTPVPMYSFRFVKPNGPKLGFRLNGFVYVNGAWRALLKSDQYLPASNN